MIYAPDELELTKYLLKSSDFIRLPPWAELEPGSFLYYVKEIWEKEQDRDGRRGHLSDQEIANKISERIGKRFTRNQFQSVFGAGRKEQKQKPVVTREIAEAFLIVAFSHWSLEVTFTDDREVKNYHRILPYNNIDLNVLVDEIVHRMYNEEIDVRCIPAGGMGPIGFYRQCRRLRNSVIIATEQQHLFMADPGTGLADWLENFRTFFRDIEIQENYPLHIWAVREPIISDDPRHLCSLYDIGRLRTALMVARAMCFSKKHFPSWELVSQNSIIAVLQNNNNDRYRSEAPCLDMDMDCEPPIQSDFIFPSVVPSVWQSKDEELSVNQLNFITTISDYAVGDLSSSYYVILHERNNRTPPVVPKISPSRDSDKSFRNLFLACRGAINQDSVNLEKDIYLSAIHHGWRFYSADEFLDHKIL